jgi:hypothetical protein
MNLIPLGDSPVYYALHTHFWAYMMLSMDYLSQDLFTTPCDYQTIYLVYILVIKLIIVITMPYVPYYPQTPSLGFCDIKITLKSTTHVLEYLIKDVLNPSTSTRVSLLDKVKEFIYSLVKTLGIRTSYTFSLPPGPHRSGDIFFITHPQDDVIGSTSHPSPHKLNLPNSNTNNNSNVSQDSDKSVVNLSNLKLTEPMISVLSKGLNFCPTPGESDIYELRKDLDKFHVSLRRKQFFSKKFDLDDASNSELNQSTSCINICEPDGPFDHPKFKQPESTRST